MTNLKYLMMEKSSLYQEQNKTQNQPEIFSVSSLGVWSCMSKWLIKETFKKDNTVRKWPGLDDGR